MIRILEGKEKEESRKKKKAQISPNVMKRNVQILDTPQSHLD